MKSMNKELSWNVKVFKRNMLSSKKVMLVDRSSRNSGRLIVEFCLIWVGLRVMATIVLGAHSKIPDIGIWRSWRNRLTLPRLSTGTINISENLVEVEMRLSFMTPSWCRVILAEFLRGVASLSRRRSRWRCSTGCQRISIHLPTIRNSKGLLRKRVLQD